MPDRFRKYWVAVAATLAVVLLVPSSASIPAPVEHLPPAPSAPELALLEELAVWVQADGPRYRLFEGESLPDLVRSRRRSFELFRSFNERHERRQLLAALPYGSLLQEAAERYRLDGLLLAAVVQAESGFDPLAVSPRGALGLMQLMPETAAHYGALEPADPRANVTAGARYLRDLLERYDDDLALALAAYNAGPGNVTRYGGVPPFRETRHYVERVLGRYVALHRELWQENELAELLGEVPAAGVAVAEVAVAR